MLDPARTGLWLVPGTAAVLFLAQVDQGPLVFLWVTPARFLEALLAAQALVSFSTAQQAEFPLEELLPWAGNV